MCAGVNRGATLNAENFRRYIGEVETQVHVSQPLIVSDNHDNPRSWDRFGERLHNHDSAKVIATVLLTTRATPLMHYGQELGRVTTTPIRVEDVKGPNGVRGWRMQKGRDGERTPMQWDTTAQAGFSTNPATWLPVGAGYMKTKCND